MRDLHKEQMNELEIRLSNSKQSECHLIDEISRLKNENITQKAKFEADKSRLQQLNHDYTTR